MKSLVASSILSFLSFLSLTTAQSSNNASAVFVYDGSSAGVQFTFALNADQSTNDLYFHLSSPAGNAWIGVGIGDRMQDSFMLIAYPSSNGTGVTISPRIATGQSEPTYQSNLVVDKVYEDDLSGANTVTGSRQNTDIVADGVCRGCGKWSSGSLDYTNTAQPFIFAVGPVFPPLNSDSQSAGMSEHMFYGHFTMDMTAATSSSGGSVPVGPYSQKSASAATDTKTDAALAPHIHGLVMCVVFIIILPLGSLLVRVWNKVKGHAICQTIGMVLFLMASAGGVYISTKFNRTKSFNSAHQVIGILILLAFLSQFALGIVHHRIFKREQRKTIMGKIHLYLGPVVILFGIINGATGIALAASSIVILPYFIIVLVFVIIYCCIRGMTWFRRRKRRAAKEGPEGYQYPQFGNSQFEHSPYATPPSNDYPPPYGDNIPLNRYERSTESVPNLNAPSVQPRTMV